MTIKEVSERTGISVDNLRYYERIGLFPSVPRKDNGIRDYNEELILWIDFAMRFKKAGISLESIIEYNHLAMLGDSTKWARRAIIEDSKACIEKKIEELQEFLKFADYKLDNYYSEVVPATEELVNDWKKNHPEAVE